jgi:fatty acid desaturase
MREGIFRHEKIGAAEKRTGECAIGWVAHYLIGIAYAFVLVLAASGAWLTSPSLMPALALGIVTVIFLFL